MISLKKKLLKVVNRIRMKIRKYSDDILLFIGIILISIGVFKIYIPAGFIALGICIIAFAFMLARSEEGDPC